MLVVVDGLLGLGLVPDDVQVARGEGGHGRVADAHLVQLEVVEVVLVGTAVALVALQDDALTRREADERERSGADGIGPGAPGRGVVDVVGGRGGDHARPLREVVRQAEPGPVEVDLHREVVDRFGVRHRDQVLAGLVTGLEVVETGGHRLRVVGRAVGELQAVAEGQREGAGGVVQLPALRQARLGLAALVQGGERPVDPLQREPVTRRQALLGVEGVGQVQVEVESVAHRVLRAAPSPGVAPSPARRGRSGHEDGRGDPQHPTAPSSHDSPLRQLAPRRNLTPASP